MDSSWVFVGLATGLAATLNGTGSRTAQLPGQHVSALCDYGETEAVIVASGVGPSEATGVSRSRRAWDPTDMGGTGTAGRKPRAVSWRYQRGRVAGTRSSCRWRCTDRSAPSVRRRRPEPIRSSPRLRPRLFEFTGRSPRGARRDNVLGPPPGQRVAARMFTYTWESRQPFSACSPAFRRCLMALRTFRGA